MIAGLVAGAAGEGLDLNDPAAFLNALGVGLTLRLWRNTPLEDVHSGWIGTWLRTSGTPHDDETDPSREQVQEYRAAKSQRWEAIDPDNWDWTSPVSDEATPDMERLKIVVDDAWRGLGIPDDVMLRANAYTAADLSDALTSILAVVDEVLTVPKDQVDGLPEVLLDVYGFFSDPERVIEVGHADCTAYDLLGPEGWDDYVQSVENEVGSLAVYARRIGLELTLQMVAVGGSAYASDWYPCAQWARVVERARVYTTSDPSKAWHGEVPFTSDAQEQAFWSAALRPWALDAKQAGWFLRMRVDDVMREIRDVDAARMGTARVPNLVFLAMI